MQCAQNFKISSPSYFTWKHKKSEKFLIYHFYDWAGSFSAWQLLYPRWRWGEQQHPASSWHIRSPALKQKPHYFPPLFSITTVTAASSFLVACCLSCSTGNLQFVLFLCLKYSMIVPLWSASNCSSIVFSTSSWNEKNWRDLKGPVSWADEVFWGEHGLKMI